MGTPGALEPRALLGLDDLVRITNPVGLVQPVGFCRIAGVELPNYCPVRTDIANAELVAGHVRQMSTYLGRPVVLENVATQLRMRAPLSEPEFLNLICATAECGLMVDVTALWANAQNLGFDLASWLEEIEPGHVVALRLSTAERRNGRWYVGSGPLPSEVWAIAAEAWSTLRPRVLLASHLWDLPHPDVLAGQLKSMTEIVVGPSLSNPSLAGA